MLAFEYGYMVSINTALGADGTHAALEATEEWNSGALGKLIRRQGVTFGVLVLSLLLMYFVSPQFGYLAILAVLAWSAVIVIDALEKRREPPVSKLAVRPLGRAPWQAWPCRVEGLRGDPGSEVKLVYLMSPDQEVVRAFRTPMPEQALKHLAHGMGVLWICGDLESPRVSGARGTAMATVKGAIVWEARQASKRDAASGPQPTPAFDRFIRDASSDDMDALLNPPY